MNNIPSVEIAEYLQTKSILVNSLDGENATPVMGETLFVGTEPADKVPCITVYDVSGSAPSLTLDTKPGDPLYMYPSIQVRVCHSDYRLGMATCENVKKELHGLNGQIGNSKYHLIECSVEVAHLDNNDKNNPRFVTSFDMQRSPIDADSSGGDEIHIVPVGGRITFPTGWEKHPVVVIRARMTYDSPDDKGIYQYRLGLQVFGNLNAWYIVCLLYTSPSPRD